MIHSYKYDCSRCYHYWCCPRCVNSPVVRGGFRFWDFPGIGYTIALRLAEDGFNIAINDIASKREKLDAVVGEIKALGREAVAVPADVSSPTEVKEMIAQTVAALDSLDVVKIWSPWIDSGEFPC